MLHKDVKKYLFYNQAKRDSLIRNIPILDETEVSPSEIEEIANNTKEYEHIFNNLKTGNLYAIRQLKTINKLNPELAQKYNIEEAHAEGLEAYLRNCNDSITKGFTHFIDNSFGTIFRRLKLSDNFPFNYFKHVDIVNECYVTGISESAQLPQKLILLPKSPKIMTMDEIKGKNYK